MENQCTTAGHSNAHKRVNSYTSNKQTVSSTEHIRKSVHFCDNWRQRNKCRI